MDYSKVKFARKILYLYVVEPTIKYQDFINTNFWPSTHFTAKNGESMMQIRAAKRPIPKKEMIIGFHSFFSYKDSESYKEPIPCSR